MWEGCVPAKAASICAVQVEASDLESGVLFGQLDGCRRFRRLSDSARSFG